MKCEACIKGEAITFIDSIGRVKCTNCLSIIEMEVVQTLETHTESYIKNFLL